LLVFSTVATAFEQILRELALGVNELIDPFFNRPAAHELVHQDVLGLADTERTVSRLILDSRIPPAIRSARRVSGRQLSPARRPSVK